MRSVGGIYRRCSPQREGAAHDGSVPQLTPRLRKRIEHDFPPGPAKHVLSYLEALPDSEYGGSLQHALDAGLQQLFEGLGFGRLQPRGAVGFGAGQLPVLDVVAECRLRLALALPGIR